MTPCPLEQTSPWESLGIHTKCRSASEVLSVCHYLSCFTLNFTHFMPSAFDSNILFRNFLFFWGAVQSDLAVFHMQDCLPSIWIFFLASPWTCGEAHPGQRPRGLQSWQGRFWLQNGWKQFGRESLFLCFSASGQPAKFAQSTFKRSSFSFLSVNIGGCA